MHCLEDLVMAAPAPSLSMSMRMTVYGISKKFPTIRNITCEQLNNWIEDESKKLVCLVSLDLCGTKRTVIEKNNVSGRHYCITIVLLLM